MRNGLLSLMPTTVATAALLVVTSGLHAGTIAVGDLRLPSTTYSGGYTYFDPASPANLTRAVVGAPVGINSEFVAVTQESGGGSPDPLIDIGLQTFSSATQIRTINRFTASGSVPRVGAVQWSIDLTPLDSYLTTNNLSATEVDFRLVTSPSDNTPTYDVYLSYTNAAESITLSSLNTGATAGSDNYANFYSPAQGVSEGQVANGIIKVLEKDFSGPLDLTIDAASLYNAGVKDFNLIMASGAFFSSRNIDISDGSGISITTVAVPEPGSIALLAVGGLLLGRVARQQSDRIGPTRDPG